VAGSLEHFDKRSDSIQDDELLERQSQCQLVTGSDP
jgi:hypothetical protein